MTKKRRLLIIGTGVVVVLVVVGFAIWVGYMNKKLHESASTSTEKKGTTQQFNNESELANDINQKYGNGDYQGAINTIEAQKNVDDVANQLLLAQAYANAGNFKKALEIYKKLDAAGKLPDDQLANAAGAAEQAGDIRTAIDYYKRAQNYAKTSKDQNLDQADVYGYKVSQLEKKL
jgi:pentatricopeptide repeat protein